MKVKRDLLPMGRCVTLTQMAAELPRPALERRNRRPARECMEARGGLRPITKNGPTLKFMMKSITRKDIEEAINRAMKGRKDREDVAELTTDRDALADEIAGMVERKDYVLEYRELRIVEHNGKVRRIDSPKFVTLVLQHLVLVKLEPLYAKVDPMVSLNCKAGCGIVPPVGGGRTGRYVLRKVKRMMYERRDLKWVVVADQRRCYEHVKEKHFRRWLKLLTDDVELRDFAVAVCFKDGRLPIGTPTSPFVHHVVMLGFHRWLTQNAAWCVGYADDVMVGCRTKEEANAMKWRVRMWWWYELGMRAKRSATRVVELDGGVAVDFCGYRVRRLAGRGHGKGVTMIRRSTLMRARRCGTDAQWASYFGLMRHADCLNEMTKIEKRMKLSELTKRVRIDRRMDARNVRPADLAKSGVEFTIYDYEVRCSEKDGRPNWVKCLIGIDEVDKDGRKTGRKVAREFHGSLGSIVPWMVECERVVGRDAMLPMEGVRLKDECGFILEGSTNQMEYIDEKI